MHNQTIIPNSYEILSIRPQEVAQYVMISSSTMFLQGKGFANMPFDLELIGMCLNFEQHAPSGILFVNAMIMCLNYCWKFNILS